MTDCVSLALLATAPDRPTAEVMLVSALHQGATPEQLREAWHTWERSQDHAKMPRGNQ